MARKHVEAVRIPLSKRPCGIEAFRVEGSVDAERVQAQWDGRWATGSKILCERALLAIAVESALTEAGVGQLAMPDGSPEELMLAMITCCDNIDVAEYQIKGHRRVITA
jgi:hypothetical protein